jgi:hypothetical protein
LDQTGSPTQSELYDWLAGPSVGLGAGFLAGVGAQWSNGRAGVQHSTEWGFYSPQVGATWGIYNACVSGPCRGKRP